MQLVSWVSSGRVMDRSAIYFCIRRLRIRDHFGVLQQRFEQFRDEDRLGKISIKGVVVGGLVDVGSSLIFGLILGLVLAFKIHAQHLRADQIHKATVTVQSANHWLYWSIGLLCSVLGGYVAARIARHDAMLNGAFSAWLCLLLELIVFAWDHLHSARSFAMGTVWTQPLLMGGAILCGFVGGWLARARTQRRLA